MTSLRKNKTILIDSEAISALELLDNGLLAPATRLMNSKESKDVIETGLIDGKTFPFPFILAPSGKLNAEVLKTLEAGEELTVLNDKEEVYATIIVEEIFEIDPKERIRQIYGTSDLGHPGVTATLSRLGSLAVSGELIIKEKKSCFCKDEIDKAKAMVGAKHTTALMMAANPLHRAHERLIRQTLDDTDLLVIFLLKPYTESNLSYDIRKETLEFFINNFLTKNKVVVVPLENSYIFAG